MVTASEAGSVEVLVGAVLVGAVAAFAWAYVDSAWRTRRRSHAFRRGPRQRAEPWGLPSRTSAADDGHCKQRQKPLGERREERAPAGMRVGVDWGSDPPKPTVVMVEQGTQSPQVFMVAEQTSGALEVHLRSMQVAGRLKSATMRRCGRDGAVVARRAERAQGMASLTGRPTGNARREAARKAAGHRAHRLTSMSTRGA